MAKLPTSVFIKSLNKKVFMRNITLFDNDRLVELVGKVDIFNELKAGNTRPLLEVFWNQLENEGKKAISDVKIEKWDGLESKGLIEFSNPSDKIMALIDEEELFQIFNAFINARRNSMPDAATNEEKKSPAVNP